MHLKATNKLLCCELHFLDLVAISIVFVLKVHNTILDRVDAVVRYIGENVPPISEQSMPLVSDELVPPVSVQSVPLFIG